MSTLRARLDADRSRNQQQAGIGAWDVADVMAVVVEWLRDLAEETHGTPSMDNDLRHDLAVVGGELAHLADRVEAGEA